MIQETVAPVPNNGLSKQAEAAQRIVSFAIAHQSKIFPIEWKLTKESGPIAQIQLSNFERCMGIIPSLHTTESSSMFYLETGIYPQNVIGLVLKSMHEKFPKIRDDIRTVQGLLMPQWLRGDVTIEHLPINPNEVNGYPSISELFPTLQIVGAEATGARRLRRGR